MDIRCQADWRNKSTVLTAYNGQQIHQYGTMNLQCYYGARESNATFFVADTPDPVIIGLQPSRELCLVVMNCEVQEKPTKVKIKDDFQKLYPDQFEGI